MNADDDSSVESFQDAKRVAYYSALLSAWIDTRMERDKTLISLSAAGIALLVTLLTTVGAPNLFVLLLYVIAFVSFASCLGSGIKVFRENSDHIRELINRGSADDLTLKRYDKVLVCSFVAAAISLILIGLASAASKIDFAGG